MSHEGTLSTDLNRSYQLPIGLETAAGRYEHSFWCSLHWHMQLLDAKSCMRKVGVEHLSSSNTPICLPPRSRGSKIVRDESFIAPNRGFINGHQLGSVQPWSNAL